METPENKYITIPNLEEKMHVEDEYLAELSYLDNKINYVELLRMI